MDINNFSKTYEVRRIESDNIDELLELCKNNETYYKYCPPDPTPYSIRSDLRALPPGKEKKDKYYVGFYNNDELIAVSDIIQDYPNDQTVFIGFFMLKKEYQHQGIASKIIEELVECFQEYQFSYIRLAYVVGNKESEGFWLRNKFIPMNLEIDMKDYKVTVLQRVI